MKLVQLLRHRLVDIVRRGCVEVVQNDHVEEDLEPNVDEVVVDEVLEVDLLLSMMSKRTKKSVKMSTLKFVARWNRLEDADLVVKNCVDVVGRKMVIVMCRCGGVMSLLMESREDPGLTGALLPC